MRMVNSYRAVETKTWWHWEEKERRKQKRLKKRERKRVRWATRAPQRVGGQPEKWDHTNWLPTLQGFKISVLFACT